LPKHLRIVSTCFLVFTLVLGLHSATFAQTTNIAFKGNVNRALKTVLANGDITVQAWVGKPLRAGESLVNLQGWFNKSVAQTKATLPVSVLYRLGDSPAAQKIKSSGKVVYIHASPYLRYTKKRSNGKVTQYNKPIRMPPKYPYGCATYLVALAPANNYQISYTYDWEFIIREAGGFESAYEITNITAAGELFRASLRSFVEGRNSCFFIATKSYF